jgi:hypothetical protein
MKLKILMGSWLCSLCLYACQGPEAEKVVARIESNMVIQADSITEDPLGSERKAMLIPQTFLAAGYTFQFGYASFDERNPRSGNPAYLQIFKNEQLIFTDSFPAEGNLSIDTLGYHEVSGNKFFFTLHHGIEAGNYQQHDRYYFISPEGSAFYLSEYNALCSGDGFSCTCFTHLFPAEKSYAKDVLTIVEQLSYNGQDQQDLLDTTSICFTGNAFTIHKLSHRLEDADPPPQLQVAKEE